MKLIPLSAKYNCKNSGLSLFAKVDDDDFECLMQKRWRAQKSCDTFYAVNNEGKYMHRQIMGLKKGDGKIIDHKFGDGLDNQKENLSICNGKQNSYNKKKVITSKSTSKYKGVWHNRKINKWICAVKKDGKTIIKREFFSEKEAALAYNVGAKQHFGNFARLNQI